MPKFKTRRRTISRHYKPSPAMAQALALVAEGVPVREAAARSGLTYQAVMYRLPGNPISDERTLAKEAKARMGRPPRTPVGAPAGSDAKIAAMRERADRGESLFHADDEPTTEDPEFSRVMDREFDRPAMKVVLR